MKFRCCLGVLFGVLALGLPANSVWAYSKTVFGPSAFNTNQATMNAALGITGYTIEDFEDATLISGLSATTNNGSSSLFLDPNPASFVWDGAQVMAGISSGDLDVTFTFDAATSFGIGIADEDGPYSLKFQINGTGTIFDAATLPNYAQADNQRNGYLRIDKEAPDALITSVRFLVDNQVNEGILFDHLAIQAVPEPLNPDAPRHRPCGALSATTGAGGRYEVNTSVLQLLCPGHKPGLFSCHLMTPHLPLPELEGL